MNLSTNQKQILIYKTETNIEYKLVVNKDEGGRDELGGWG